MPESAKHSTKQSTLVPTARSPLASTGPSTVIDGWEYASGVGSGPVVVSDRSALAKVLIRTKSTPSIIAALGTRFGRAAWKDRRLVVGSGPDEWLVLGPPGSTQEITDEVNDTVAAEVSDRITMIDLTHGRALMRISGPETMSLLSRVTAVDLDDRLVPNGSALRTSAARVVTDLVRDDQGGSISYLLHCERSSGLYLQQSLLAAGADLGVAQGASSPAWPDHEP